MSTNWRDVPYVLLCYVIPTTFVMLITYKQPNFLILVANRVNSIPFMTLSNNKHFYDLQEDKQIKQISRLFSLLESTGH